MSVDLSGMSRRELEALQSNIEKALQDIAKNELKEARKAAEAAAAKYGFSLADVTGGAGKSAKKAAQPARYVNPQDPSQTWSGRGRQPQWYKDAISSGVAPETMEV